MHRLSAPVFSGVLASICASFLAGLLALCVSSRAQADIVAVPALTTRVTDLTQTLSAEQTAALTQQLLTLEQAKGSQLAVLMVPSTGDESIEQYGIRVVDQWKLGRKGVDDGVLLLVAKNDKRVRIEVGRGLEGALPDITSVRIIREFILPAFRQGDFAGGVQVGVEKISSVIQGEALPPPSGSKAGGGATASTDVQELSLFGLNPVILLLLLVGGFILSQIAGRWIGRGGVAAASVLAAIVSGTPVLLAMLFGVGMALVLMLVSSHLFIQILSLFLQSRGGGGSFGGGGGGGGFSGGGGGFSGGGASGGWE